MKTLVVYINDSYYKFDDLFSSKIYSIIDNQLTVMQISKIDGSEHIIACFRNWDYFVIEED